MTCPNCERMREALRACRDHALALLNESERTETRPLCLVGGLTVVVKTADAALAPASEPDYKGCTNCGHQDASGDFCVTNCTDRSAWKPYSEPLRTCEGCKYNDQAFEPPCNDCLRTSHDGSGEDRWTAPASEPHGPTCEMCGAQWPDYRPMPTKTASEPQAASSQPTGAHLYRKRPVVISAVVCEQEEIIHTLEGDHLARPGDYIITGIKGERYPCKPDIFAATYEPAASPPSVPAPVNTPRDVNEEGTCCVCGRLASACRKPIIDTTAYPDEGEWFCSRECNEAYHAAEGDYDAARAALAALGDPAERRSDR